MRMHQHMAVLIVGLVLYPAVRAIEATDARKQAVAAERAQREARQGRRTAGEPLLPPALAAIVRGRLLDQEGKPLGGESLAFVREGSVGITDGLTSDDGTFQVVLPVDRAWQVVLLENGNLSGPRSEAMNTAVADSTSAEPNYDLELRVDGTRLQAQLTPLGER